MFSGKIHDSGDFGEMKRQSTLLSDDASETGTEMRRDMSVVTVDQVNRLSTNKDLSALTNQVLELILDNVKLTHMNQKLVEYFKEQSSQLEVSAEKAQSTV